MSALLPLFNGFFRVGLFGFGGGPSMLPLMKAECVTAGWVDEAQFLEGLAIGNALPGPIAIKMAVYVGYVEAGIAGAAVSLVGVCLPAIVLMALLGGLLIKNRDNPWVAAALQGVKPAVVGMLAWVVWDLGPAGLTSGIAVIIAVVAFAALIGKLHPGIVMVLAASAGVLLFR